LVVDLGDSGDSSIPVQACSSDCDIVAGDSEDFLDILQNIDFLLTIESGSF
jgi:hypothetical protein